VTSQPFPSSGPPTAADAAAGGLSLLQTAERVATQIREEAGAEAQRMLEAARAQADQIRNEARAEAPRLRAETDELRAEHDRAVEALRALRHGIGELVDRRSEGHQPDHSQEHGE
jgi:cell division septum initiation protein DivIVA